MLYRHFYSHRKLVFTFALAELIVQEVVAANWPGGGGIGIHMSALRAGKIDKKVAKGVSGQRLAVSV